MKELTINEKLEIVKSLFDRENPSEECVARLKKCYPDAPKEVIEIMKFHLYVDGHRALLDLLVNLEQFLTGEKNEIEYGNIIHMQYHLYNFILLKNLIPYNKQDMVDIINEAIDNLKDDPKYINDVIEMLDDLKDNILGSTAHYSPIN